MKIAIIGHGFVGKAVDFGFENPDVQKQLIDPVLYNNTVEDVDKLTDYAFVCVPTPMLPNGEINDSIVRNVVESLIKNTEAIVIIKSTVIPTTIKELSKLSKDIVYNPEFLMERSALVDFVNPDFHIIGSNDNIVSMRMERLYNDYSNCIPAPFFHMKPEEASFVKYGINTFLSTKVTFFNQLFDACEDMGVSYNKVHKAIGSDPRIGHGHTKVPGFDMKQGYGGACFPKDVNAFRKFTDKFTLLDTVTEINNSYRSQYELDDREKQQNVNFDN